MRRLLPVLFVILMVTPSHAQRTRPPIDVDLATENTYTHASLWDAEIILYVIYHDTTLAVRAYAVWNNSESTAHATLSFHNGDDLEITASPGTRESIRVAARSYTMVPDEGSLIDTNVASYTLGHASPIRSRAPRGPFPLPTER